MQQSQPWPLPASRKSPLTGVLTGFKIQVSAYPPIAEEDSSLKHNHYLQKQISAQVLGSWVVSSCVQLSGDGRMSARRREAELLIQSEQGVDSPTPLPSSLLLLGDAQTFSLRSLSPTLLHGFAFSPSFLSLSPSLTHACHFHFSSLSFFLPAGSLSLSLSLSLLPHSHSLVISLTLHALSTVKADCYQQRHTHTHKTHPHTHTNWLLRTMLYSFSLPLSLLPLSPTDNEITSNAVIFLMSFTCNLRHKKEWFNSSWPTLPGPQPLRLSWADPSSVVRHRTTRTNLQIII